MPLDLLSSLVRLTERLIIILSAEARSGPISLLQMPDKYEGFNPRTATSLCCPIAITYTKLFAVLPLFSCQIGACWVSSTKWQTMHLTNAIYTRASSLAVFSEHLEAILSHLHVTMSRQCRPLRLMSHRRSQHCHRPTVLDACGGPCWPVPSALGVHPQNRMLAPSEQHRWHDSPCYW